MLLITNIALKFSPSYHNTSLKRGICLFSLRAQRITYYSPSYRRMLSSSFAPIFKAFFLGPTMNVVEKKKRWGMQEVRYAFHIHLFFISQSFLSHPHACCLQHIFMVNSQSLIWSPARGGTLVHLLHFGLREINHNFQHQALLNLVCAPLMKSPILSHHCR